MIPWLRAALEKLVISKPSLHASSFRLDGNCRRRKILSHIKFLQLNISKLIESPPKNIALHSIYSKSQHYEIVGIVMDLKLQIMLSCNDCKSIADPVLPSRIKFLRKFTKKTSKIVKRLGHLDRKLVNSLAMSSSNEQHEAAENKSFYREEILLKASLNLKKLMHFYIILLNIDLKSC